jgi:predicted porin
MQDAFILISRPFQSIPSNFGGYEGYPSNMNMKVSACAGTAQHNYNDGYLETDENTVWGTGISYTYGNTTINATDDEIAEIQELFNKGVIVNV